MRNGGRMEKESEIENTLATLQKKIQRLKQHRAVIQRQRVNNPSTDTQSAALSVPPVIKGSTSTTMSPQKLLCFVAKQLQTLTSVWLANFYLRWYLYLCARHKAFCNRIAGVYRARLENFDHAFCTGSYIYGHYYCRKQMASLPSLDLWLIHLRPFWIVEPLGPMSLQER